MKIRNQILWWGISLAAFLCLETLAGPQELCPRFILKSNAIHLSDTEKKLVCGDPKNATWNHIPDNQAIFNFKNFLQARGYFHPKFEKGTTSITVDPGPTTVVSKFSVQGGPPDLNPEKLREIVGETLQPDLLDETKQRVIQRLRSLGYGCPKVEMVANFDTGELIAKLSPGKRQDLISVTEQKIEGGIEGLFRRYDAFELNKTYNFDLLRLTERRILNHAVVESTFFETKCNSEGVTVHQRFIPGPPRLITIGAGFDTERLFTLRTSWRNSRWGETASNIEVVAAASFKDQVFQVDSSWYLLPRPSRFFLKPSFLFKHENYQNYEHLTWKLGLAPAVTFDNQVFGAKFALGPTLNLNRTIRGVGPEFSKFLSFHADLSATEHYYELFQNSPREGWDLQLEGNFTHQNVLSNVTAQMLRLSFDKLWNISQLDPPLFVVGFRTHLATTLTAENNMSDKIPTDFRFFLGGSSDLRGFSLRELPGNNGKGALTAIDAELELRANILPGGLEPFIFVDAGLVGPTSLSLDGPLFWSPGFGLRWQFSFGVIRTTFAHGFFSDAGIARHHSHPQIYFSFGEEF